MHYHDPSFSSTAGPNDGCGDIAHGKLEAGPNQPFSAKS